MDCLSNETIKLLKIIPNRNIENDFLKNKFFMKLYKNMKKNVNKININNISLSLILMLLVM